jgi:hypothetical protein
MRSVRNLGAPREQLWNTFSGDLLMWEWLNRSVPAGERVATLEFRTYYIHRPQDLFYLDGIESVPLLDLRSPDDVLEFFKEEGVRYVVLPNWSTEGLTRHPVTGLLPVFWMLGGPSFPAVAAFATRGSDQPSVVYSVGAPDIEPTIGIYPGTSDSISLGDRSVTIAADSDDPRVFVPVPRDRPPAIVFEYETSGRGDFEVNRLDPGTYAWEPHVGSGRRTGRPGWEEAVVLLPLSDEPIETLGIHVRGDPLPIRGLRLAEPGEIIVRAGAGAPPATGSAVRQLESQDDSVRLYVPVDASGVAGLHVSYRDRGSGRVVIRVHDPISDDRRELATVPLADTGEWKSIDVPVSPGSPGFAEVSVFVDSALPLEIAGVSAH